MKIAMNIPLDREPELHAIFAKYWRPDHPFASDTPLFRFFFRAGDKLTVAAAYDDARIHAILCYIPNSNYDPKIPHERDFAWLGPWRRVDEGFAGSGVMLFKALESHFEGRVGAIHVDDAIVPTYKKMGWPVYKMNNYFLDLEAAAAMKAGCDVTPYAEPEWDDFKTYRYYGKRYHQYWRIYRYLASGGCMRFYESKKKVGMIVDNENTKGCIICDYYTIMITRRLDLIQLWNYGLDKAAMLAAGWKDAHAPGAPPIPSLFAPFVAETQSMYCAHSPRLTGHFSAFYGNGDRDRPNIEG